MNSIRYNNPWSLLNNLQQELHNPARCQSNNSTATTSTTDWAPSVDINEDEKAFILLADIPGVNPDNIDISTDKGVLTIKGERKSVDITDHENYRRVERQSGNFYRQFSLPDSADGDNISAKSEHGVLTITIPKQEAAVSRRIEVKH